MLAVDDALKLIAEHTPAPIVEKVPVDMKLGGSVLAEDVKATESVPAFRASIVDGYAVKIPSSGKFEKGVYPVAIVSHAQAGNVKDLKEGEIARITTGAPLPPGADAVVMVEDTVLKSQTDDGSEEKEVEILTDEIKPGENVREVGSDVRSGDTILKRGEGVTVVGGEFGLLASVGTREVSVYRRPVVGVLSTGDEIIPHDREAPLQLGEVRDTNRPTLITAARSHRFEVVDLGIASDKYVHFQTRPRSRFLTYQTRHTRANPPRGSLEMRHHHYLRRRVHGRARSPQTHHRTLAGRHNSLRTRQHEARQTDHVRHSAHQSSRWHTHLQSHLLPPG
jgi:gephyrin